MHIYTKTELIEKLKEISRLGWVKNRRKGNQGGIGNTLEDLLDIEENNLPLPNSGEWELKTHRKGVNSLTTLFHMEPSPRALKFVPQIFLLKYGWRHQFAGTTYPKSEMSFRQTINAANPSDRGFKVVIDRTSKKVLISFDSKVVDNRHKEWLKIVNKRVGLREIDPQPYWGFDDLQYNVGTKLNNCFYVEAEREVRRKNEYFRFTDVLMLKSFNFEGFLHGLETGNILVDFDARTGHNHGTKFRMRQGYFPNLYKDAVKIV